MSAACDDARAALVLGRSDDAEVLRHIALCETCRADAPAWRALAATLASARVPTPPAALAARVRTAAAPLLARRARAATWRAVAAAVAAAMLPLPLVLLVDGWVLRALYDTLHAVFPRALSLYVVVNYMTLLAVLLTLAYGAVPLLAERQARLRREERYG